MADEQNLGSEPIGNLVQFKGQLCLTPVIGPYKSVWTETKYAKLFSFSLEMYLITESNHKYLFLT